MKLSRSPYLGLAFVLVLAVSVGAQIPVGTAFTYQGRLDDGGASANGIYDLEFALYDAASAGSQIGSTVAKEDVAVANGLFVVALDFDSGAFAGSARWLQIGVRPGASGEAFTQLASRQELTPTPNAIHATTATAASWSGITDKPAGFADDVDNDSGGDITGVAAGSGLAGGGATGDVTLSLDTAATDGRYVLKAGDTMTGTLTLSPVTGVGLSTTADVNLQGRVMRGARPFIHANTATYNTSIGENALSSSSAGSFNTATGREALRGNTVANMNTAMGAFALYSNTTGDSNTATGNQALYFNTTAYQNTATGDRALYSNATGVSNTAVGGVALYSNTTGSWNIALGFQAGRNATTGDWNIYVGNQGVAAEGNTIRIGDSYQTRFFAAGIRGVTTGVDDALPVLIDSAGQLGTVSSSIRFKQDVRDMSDASAALLQLRPVTFRYKGRTDVPEARHYGLIAEEVNEVIPELVARSADGQVETVKYHELPAMLLNELQKMHHKVQELEARLAQVERQ